MAKKEKSMEEQLNEDLQEEMAAKEAEQSEAVETKKDNQKRFGLSGSACNE